MSEANDHDEVFKPLPSIRNIPFINLRFARPRYIVFAIIVWIVAFILIQGLGGSSDPLELSPGQILAQGSICLPFSACCLVILFNPSLEDAVLAKPEERRPFRRDLRNIAFLFVFVGVLAIMDAIKVYSNQ